MSNQNNKTQQTNNSTMIQQPNKPKRKSVQFGRVSYSDDSKEMKLTQQHQEGTSSPDAETPCKFMERSAMCSSVPIPPPAPPQRKASAEVVLLEGEIDDFDDFGTSSISVTSLTASLVTSEESSEEEKEDLSDSSRDSVVYYTSPLMTMRKTISASPVAPTRTRPRLVGGVVSPSQLPPCFPTRCL